MGFVRGQHTCTTDSNGFRNGLGWPGDDGLPIVLFIGDSVTFCLETPDRQTTPSELAKRLASDGHPARVLNAGVRGFNTLQSKRMAEDCLEQFPDINVVVYTYCGNDLEENMVPNLRCPLGAPWMKRVGDGWQEMEVTDPTAPWGHSFLGWQPRPPETAEIATAWMASHSLLASRCLDGWRNLPFLLEDEPAFPPSDRLPWTSTYASWHEWAARHGGWDAMKRLLEDLKNACGRRDAVLLVTLFHDGTPECNHPELEEICTDLGILFVNPGGAFSGSPDQYKAMRTDGQYDPHYGPMGTQALAKALAPVVEHALAH